MADPLESMSNEELMRIAGVSAPAAQSDPLEAMSDEELMKIAGVSNEPKGFLESAWDSVGNIPSDLYNVGSAAIDFARSPVETVKRNPERALEVGTTLGSALAGAGAGAAMGALGGPLAPVTVPLGGIIGGVVGPFLTDKMAQDRGDAPETTWAEDKARLGYGLGQGAALGAAGTVVKGLGTVTRGTGNVLGRSANALEKQAVGIKPSQLARSGAQYLDESGQVVDDVADATQVASKFDESFGRLKDRNLLVSSNPEKLKIRAEQLKTESLGNRAAVIEQVDQHLADFKAQSGINVKLKPNWSYAEDFIAKGGPGTAGKEAILTRELNRIKASWEKKPGKTFDDLVKFKNEIEFNDMLSVPARGKMVNQIYRGIRERAEQVADRVTPNKGDFAKINQELGDLFSIQKAIDGKVASASLKTTLQDLGDFKNIAGGAMAMASDSILPGAYVAARMAGKLSPVATAKGARAVGSGLRQLGTGQSRLGAGLQAGSPAIQGLNQATINAKQDKKPGEFAQQIEPGSNQNGVGGYEQQKQSQQTGALNKTNHKPLFSGSMKLTKPQLDEVISAVVPEEDRPIMRALIHTESRGNTRAVSPKGAKGLTQLMPAMAKAFGVEDPFDPVANLQGGYALFQEERDRFKTLPLALAAYNAGSPSVNRAIKKAGSREIAEVLPHLPSETQIYVKKIMKALA